MSNDSLAEFLTILQDQGELIRVSAAVDPALELAAITDRVAKNSPHGGPALLFENVKNATIPIVTNLLGSDRRLCLALGVENLDRFAEDLDRRTEPQQSGGWLNALKLTPDWGGLGKWSPRLVKSAICQQVVRLGRDVNLWDLPVPRAWPEESDPVITAGTLVACPPGSPALHYSRSPLVVTGQTELGWYDGDPADQELVEQVIASRQNLPVAISLGANPVMTVATDLRRIVEPRLFTGFVQGAGLEIVRCRSNELEVPANSEFVIEGYIDAANPVSERPLTIARDNGRYLSRPFPLIQVTAITQRANPVFPATVTSGPPCEESWVGLAGERLTLPLLRRIVPEIVDVHRPFHGAGRNLIFVGIRKTRDFQARKVIHALWGFETCGSAKTIIVVDDSIDVKNADQVWLTVGNQACPGRDYLFSDGLARDDDYTSTGSMRASRVGIDATRKSARESGHVWPQTLEMTEEVVARIDQQWSQYGLER